VIVGLQAPHILIFIMLSWKLEWIADFIDQANVIIGGQELFGAEY